MVILVIVFGIILSFIVMIGAYCCCKVASKEDGYIEELNYDEYMNYLNSDEDSLDGNIDYDEKDE